MRRLLIVAGALAVLAAPAPAGAATRAVSIVAAGFSPATVTIRTGDRITWTNRDNKNHQVVADSGAFASPVLRPGRSYSFTFRAAGTYRYRDALEPAERGTIRVTGPPPSVSIAATIPILVFGGETHLQGAISNGRTGETVTIWAQPYGQASYAQVAQVLTTTNGAYDVVVEPTILTNYQARWGSAASQPVTLQVRPKLSFMPSAERRGWMYATVAADKSFARARIYLQRRTQFGQWVTTARFLLGQRSGRLFRRPRVAGTYRVFITINQAGSGYLEGWSGTQRFRSR